jgi:DNA-binding transcriptional MerR regulator
MRELDIAEVVARAGVPASTLRYYEEKELIASLGRRGLRRTFSDDVLQRLTLISIARQAGFQLDEIARMFAPDGALRIDRRKLVAKADELERTISRLTTLRKGLIHAANCRAPSHTECPTFRRLLRMLMANAPRAATPKRVQASARRGKGRNGKQPL